MAGKLEKLTPLQSKAVDAMVKDALKAEVASGRQFSADEFIAEKTKAITGSDMPGHYKRDHARSVDDATTKFIERTVKEHDKKRPAFGGEYMQLPTVPLERTEDKGRLL